ncbi:MAG: tRNA (guanosine(46)-N7)-methyltransferase TrmB [Deltaproteobacteria bacterium]|jgi:tRNA (guanine-N7-)-methyltransferase|nr:tRNA (guanosine(46)-N7)-methyltransferase TrmB [Deltaproteobacteria bacterium]
MEPKTRLRRPRLVETKTLPNPTEYVLALIGEYRDWAYDEERAPRNRGVWRKLFGDEDNRPDDQTPMDLEIGTGNGYFFANRAATFPDRLLVGMELKYKPLIQSIRRARRQKCVNARIARYDANCLEDLFGDGELNHVFIHHPDPWPRQRDWKHRLIQEEFLELLWPLMRPGSFVNFKTDSEDYYDWALPIFEKSKFKKLRATRDLHRSEWASENFVTHFESLFLQKGQPIFYCRFEKP